MAAADTVIATFADHPAAEVAIGKLTGAGFSPKSLSIAGRGYHSEEKMIGFYNAGDRIRFWGARGAFWGGLWGLFLGGLFMTAPFAGPVVVLGYLATVVIAGVEGALAGGGLGALGAALAGIGVPKDSIIQYETALKADKFLVMAHGAPEDMARARALLATANPAGVDTHAAASPAGPAEPRSSPILH